MKRYKVEWIILALQTAMFYVYPIIGLCDPIGMVLIILSVTLLLSLMLGILSGSRIKCGYPFAIAVVFVPSVWIYYNESALVHALWYLVVSAVGLGLGMIFRKLVGRK